MRSFLSSLFGIVVFGMLTIAIFGAVTALVGGLLGSTGMKQIGGTAAGLGALGLIAVFATPIGRVLGQISRHTSTPRNSENET